MNPKTKEVTIQTRKWDGKSFVPLKTGKARVTIRGRFAKTDVATFDRKTGKQVGGSGGWYQYEIDTGDLPV